MKSEIKGYRGRIKDTASHTSLERTTSSASELDGGGKKLEEKDSKAKDIVLQKEAAAEELKLYDDRPIRWKNIIFLPFQTWWQIVVLITVIIKCLIAPLSARHGFVHCSNLASLSFHLEHLINFYKYFADPIYVVDTFLHILHRQVSEEAMKREYLPKPLILILFDILSLIPFYEFYSDDMCTNRVKIWPNVLLFIQMLPIYRIAYFFQINVTHSYQKLFTGYMLLCVLVTNASTWLLILMTYEGLCEVCTTKIYDWRLFNIDKLMQQGSQALNEYVVASNYVTSLLFRHLLQETVPNTYLEFFGVMSLALSGYFVNIMIICPKLFGENNWRMKSIFRFQYRVQELLAKLKSSNSRDYVRVEQFYTMVWKKQQGITKIPRVFHQFPKNLRTDMKLDLAWMVFYHSPILRNTSLVFKRWLCAHVELDYKLPGDRFFYGPQCFSKLYYIKNGVVQIYSSDDSTAATLSVTSGTVFGDINFYAPPENKQVFARCLSYCEFYYISRINLLQALVKFPEDKRVILKLTKDKLKHARDLHNSKKDLSAKHRSEEEGFAWLKRRWWQICHAIRDWKSGSVKRACKIPNEEMTCRCSKYIGQLVLCEEDILRKSKLFLNFKFPWTLTADTMIVKAWRKIVICTVYIVIILVPPCLAQIESGKEPRWYKALAAIVTIIYILDIVHVMATAKEGEAKMSKIAAVFARCKSTRFLLDVLSTPCVDIIFHNSETLGKFQNLGAFNKLLKAYLLFDDKFKSDWSDNYLYDIYLKIALISFLALYVPAYFMFILAVTTDKVNLGFFFKYRCGDLDEDTCVDFYTKSTGLVTFDWISSLFLYSEGLKDVRSSIEDLTLGTIFVVFYGLLFLYIRVQHITALYLQDKSIANFQYLVAKIGSFYERGRNMHPDLIERLDAYFAVHYRYNKGITFLRTDLLKDEPFDVYWSVYGQVAEKLLEQTDIFQGTDSAFLKKLVPKGKFIIIPKNGLILRYGMLCEDLNFLVRGEVICDYQDDDQNTKKKFISTGATMGLISVFFKKPLLKTYTAVTDVEIFYISRADLLHVLHYFPEEKSYFTNVIKELGPEFDKLYQDESGHVAIHTRIVHHSIYQYRKRERLQGLLKKFRWLYNYLLSACKEYRTNPESKFIQVWIVVRVISYTCQLIVVWFVVLLSSPKQELLSKRIQLVNRIISFFDIIIKLCLPYYDERGIVITSIKKCAGHYLKRGFCIDFISISGFWRINNLPLFYRLFGYVDDTDERAIVKCLFAYLALYLVAGLFNYYDDRLSKKSCFIKIAKWQVIIAFIALIPVDFGLKHCLWMNGGDKSLGKYIHSDTCFMPGYLDIGSGGSPAPTKHELYLMFAECLCLAQNAFFNNFLGMFAFKMSLSYITLLHCFLSILFWYQMCVCQATVILHARGNSLVRHNIAQLEEFLKNERIEKSVINRGLDYCNYWCKRTAGIDQVFIKQKVSVVYRQDLSYFFYSRTLEATDTILQSGESAIRQLAGLLDLMYILPNEDIIREMDLCKHLFIVHRGKVVVKQKGKKLTTLTKGCLFGLLNGSSARPSPVTVQAEEYTDLLFMTSESFQEIVSNNVRKKVAESSTCKYNFIIAKKHDVENPQDTVKYILRGKRTIRLPRMKEPVTSEESVWFGRWLLWCWVINPVLTSIISTMIFVPQQYLKYTNAVLYVMDFLHFIYIISQFYRMELTIVDRKCKYKYIKCKEFADWKFYFDTLSVILPIFGSIFHIKGLELIRLLRIYTITLYHNEFCADYAAKTSSKLLKLTIILVLIHFLACGWIAINCKFIAGYPTSNIDLSLHNDPALDIWRGEWTETKNRFLGCPRTTKSRQIVRGKKKVRSRFFFTARKWYMDYVIAVLQLVIYHTRMNMDVTLPWGLSAIFYKVFSAHVIYLIDLWITSYAISAIYGTFREMYHFDYNVIELLKYMKVNGISNFLSLSVETYAKMLWRRHKGSQIPEITYQMPMCLRQDVFDSLYMYHLQTPILFQCLPPHFLRQMVVRLKRNFIFPGKYIVQEGDIHACLYFIHEGEVEKWYTDHHGENRLASVLSTNGYFGILPGLFPNVPYQFSYYSRTIVDIVSLAHGDWQDLLDGYPDIRKKLYKLASKMKTMKPVVDKKIPT